MTEKAAGKPASWWPIYRLERLEGGVVVKSVLEPGAPIISSIKGLREKNRGVLKSRLWVKSIAIGDLQA